MDDRRIKNAAGTRCNSALLVTVKLILDVRLQFDRLVGSKRVKRCHVDTDLQPLRRANHHARYISAKAAIGVRLKMADEIELKIDLLWSHDIRRRDIEQRRLGHGFATTTHGKSEQNHEYAKD